MNTNVEKAQTLEERINTRIHESIGDLITDADLRKIIERGVENALFQKRPADLSAHRGFGTPTPRPALVDEMVEKHLGTRMEEAVTGWLKDNPEKMQAAVDDAIRRGVGDAMIRTLDERFARIFTSGVDMMRSQGMLPPSPY